MASKKTNLKIAVIIEAGAVPRWTAEILKSLNNAEFVSVITIIRRDKSGLEKPPVSPPIVYRLYEKLDAELFKGQIADNNSFERVNLNESLNGIEVVHLDSRRNGEQKSEVSRLSNSNLDVIFNFTQIELPEWIYGIPRFGVWRLSFGNRELKDGVPPGLWEIILQDSVSSCSLNARTSENDGEKVIYHVHYATDENSLIRNKNRLYRHSIKMPLRALKRLHERGTLMPMSLNEDFLLVYSGAEYGWPGNITMIRFIFRLIYKFAAHKSFRLFNFNQWTIAYHLGTESEYPHMVMNEYQHIIPPKDRFWADCFSYVKDGRYYVFVEEYIYRRGKAHISILEINPDGNHTQPRKVIEEDYHLSYPFLIEDGGELYMMPETERNRTVQLYKCLEFPLKWKLEAVLLQDIQAVDATIEKIDGRYWMFTTVFDKHTSNGRAQLHLYYADRLLGEWTPHRNNPVIVDERRARPAGRIIKYDGKYYRPSQICVPYYGWGIAINRIEKIDLEDYEEQEIGRMTPTWREGLSGVHTINCHRGFSVIDFGYKRNKIFDN